MAKRTFHRYTGTSVNEPVASKPLPRSTSDQFDTIYTRFLEVADKRSEIVVDYSRVLVESD